MSKRLVPATELRLGGHRRGWLEPPQLFFRALLVVMLVCLLSWVPVACEGGYVTRGERTRTSQLGNRGEIDVHIDSANGRTTKDIELDCTDCIVDVEVTLRLEQGTFKLEFLGEDDEVTLALEADPGEQASGRGYMVTDAFGEGEYRVTANEAQGVSYQISFQIR